MRRATAGRPMSTRQASPALCVRSRAGLRCRRAKPAGALRPMAPFPLHCADVVTRHIERWRGVSLRCSRANRRPRHVRLRCLLALRDTTFSFPHTTSNEASRCDEWCQSHGRCRVVMDHQCSGLLQGLSPLGGPHAAGVSGTVCVCTTTPREVKVSPPDVRPTCVSLSHVAHCA